MLTDDVLRVNLGYYSGPSLFMVPGDTMHALMTELLTARQAQRAALSVVEAARHLAMCPLQDGIRAMEALCLAVAEHDGENAQ